MLPLAARQRAPATLPADGALDRATAALDELADELATWLGAELVRLAAARDGWRRSRSAQATHALRGCAHDLKGLAGTCGFPLAGRMAGSLERLLQVSEPPPRLVDAHVEAVRATVGEAARAADHAVGVRLAEALEHAVARLGR